MKVKFSMTQLGRCRGGSRATRGNRGYLTRNFDGTTTVGRTTCSMRRLNDRRLDDDLEGNELTWMNGTTSSIKQKLLTPKTTRTAPCSTCSTRCSMIERRCEQRIGIQLLGAPLRAPSSACCSRATSPTRQLMTFCGLKGDSRPTRISKQRKERFGCSK